MTRPLHVKPAFGLVVIDPITRQRLPDAGAEVPETTYWLRRLDDRDVQRVEPPAAAAPKQKTKRAEASADDSRSDP